MLLYLVVNYLVVIYLVVNWINLIQYLKDSLIWILERLNFQQTTFGQEIGFRMRTFRFTTGESSTDAQQQTVSCELHLEPSADIVEEQAADCSCYTEDGCRGEFSLNSFSS